MEMPFNYDNIQKYETVEVDGHKFKTLTDEYIQEVYKEVNYFKEKYKREHPEEFKK